MSQSSKLIPNSFQHPNVLIDRLAYYLTPEENVVLDKAVREILGWHNKIESRKAPVSLSVFVDGKLNKETGERLCLGCGLGIQTVRKALAALDEFKILVKVGKATQDGQLFWLQDDEAAIDWDALEERRAELDEKNLKKTRKATKASLKQRGVTSDVTPGGNVARNSGLTSDVGPGITSDVNKETQEKPKENKSGHDISSSLEIWQQAQTALELQMTHATFQANFAGVHPLPGDNNTFKLAVPNERIKEVIDNRLNETILRALAGIDPGITEIEVVVG